MERAAAPDWIQERRDEARRRRRAGHDPYEAQARRYAFRERMMLAGATLAMVVLVSTFYAVLIR